MSQRDPARYGLFIASGALNALVGVLLALNGDVLLRFIGIFDAVVGVALLILAIGRYRRERARTD